MHHNGIDLAAPKGLPLIAAASGIVREAERKRSYGNRIIIDPADGYATIYSQLDEILVKAGQSVRQGALIGKVGSSGISTGPHLHFELRQNGIAIDPLEHIKLQTFNHSLVELNEPLPVRGSIFSPLHST